MKTNITKLILIFFISTSISLAGDIIEILKYEFKDEIEQSKTKPEAREWKLSKIKGRFITKRHPRKIYKLTDYYLHTFVEPNIYSLELVFQRGKQNSKKIKKEFYYIWFDGNKIIFLVNDKKYKYDIGKFYEKSFKTKSKSRRAVKNKNSVVLNIKLPAYRGTVILSLQFDKI